MSSWPFLKRLIALLFRQKRAFWLMIMLSAFSAVMMLTQPFLFTWLVNQLDTPFTQQTPVDSDTLFRSLVIFTILILIIQGIQIGINYYRVRLGRSIALRTANQIRQDLFKHLLHLPYSYFLEHNAGGLASTWLNDVDDVDVAISGFFEQAVRAVFMILCFGVVLTVWNPIIGVLAITLLPLTLIAQRLLRKKVIKSSRVKVDLRKEMVSDLSESVGNASVVKSFCLEPTIGQHLSELSRRFTFNDIVLETQQSALRSSSSILLVFTQYAFFVFGAIQVIKQGLPIGDFIGQYSMLVLLTGPMNSLLDYSNRLSQSQASMHRVDETLALALEGAGNTHHKNLPTAPDGGITVTIERLGFSYDGRAKVFDGLSFSAQAGQTIALVGPSGGGKTTLFHLIMGFYEHQEGSIFLNGIDCRELDLNSMRQQMGIVFQEQMLFNASVRDNLLMRCQESASDEALWQVLEQAHAAEFVRALPGALDATVGHGGTGLSGGQRQRLAIARALLKNPPLLLLDEATSALDSLSEQHIQQALQSIFENRTSIVAAHRLSTIAHADQIMVIDGGRVQAQGNHQALLETSELYRSLYASQVDGFVNWEGNPHA